MKKLEDKFTIEKYGLKARLVSEDDAEFIVSLRSNERLSRYIHQTSPDVSKQIEWIKEYKKREEKGEDYYFIYSLNDEPVGLNRLYDIDETSFTGGSFVFKPSCPFEIPVLSTLIQFHIAFDILDKKMAYGDIRKNNLKVIKFHKILNVEFGSEDDLNYYYKYNDDTFRKVRPKIESMLIY